MKLTPSQQAAVDHRGSKMLVSASAGSGKTEVLARRCVSLVLDPDHPCDVTQLLVVTFTRAAAAELRIRVARLLREAEYEVESRVQLEHLRRQAALIGMADIGTIDSWCQRLVREHFVQAEVDPNFGILSNTDAQILQREVLDRLFEDVFDGALPQADAVRAWLSVSGQLDPQFLRDMIASLHAFRGQLVNPQSWFDQQQTLAELSADEWTLAGQRQLASGLMREIELQLNALDQLLLQQKNLPEGCSGYQESLRELKTALANPQNLMQVIAQLQSLKLKATASTDELAAIGREISKQWLKKRLQDHWSDKALHEILSHSTQSQGRQRMLIALEAEYHIRLNQAKQELRRYGFEDVQRIALDLLGDPQPGERRQATPLARKIRARYRHVLVDEYQDTSPAQVELLRLVTADQPSNAFLVGDVKQSIYRFRRAEPRLFTQQAEAFSRGNVEGRLLHLTDNFRSHSRVLEPLNDIFAALFDPTLGGTLFDADQRLIAARGKTEPENPTLDCEPRIQIRLLEQPKRIHQDEGDDGESYDGGQDLNRIEREAALVGQEIHALIERGVEIPDRKTHELRALGYEDITILVRSARENAVQIAGMLRDQNVPAVAIGRESIFDADVVQDVLNVLRLLVTRRDDICLAAYLRGPLVELDEPSLLAIRQFSQANDFLSACEDYLDSGPAGEVVERLRRGFEQLEIWNGLARESSLPTLMQEIARVGALEAFSLAQPGGSSRVAMLHSLVDYAADFGEDDGSNVADFVSHVDAVLSGKLDGPSVSGSVVNSVSVMTVHASKGLEFPVVFVLGAGSAFNLKDGKQPLLCDAEVGLGLKTYDDQVRQYLRTPAQHILSKIVNERAIEEELRLLYVAATRAREVLCVVGHTDEGQWEKYQETWAGGDLPLLSRMGAKSMLDWIQMAVASLGTDDPRWNLSLHAANEITPQKRARSFSTAQPSEAAMRWAEDSLLQLEVSEQHRAESLPAVVSVSVLKQVTTEESDVVAHMTSEPTHLTWAGFSESGGSEPAVIDGAALGSAVHRFFEFTKPTALRGEESLENAIAQATANGVLSSSDAAGLPRESLLWFGASELGRLMASHENCLKREVPFAYLLPGDGEAPLVRGVVDAVLMLPEGMTVVDYKTDRFTDDLEMVARIASYERQVRVYAQALEAVMGKPVQRRVLVLLRSKLLLEVSAGETIDAASLRAAGARGIGYAPG